ncbi:siderophore ABC transporter substrate-binding protein [Azospirillum sp. ST 5-10]|uniref:siderophore ABC transporter substrate-binding protein n=1 Tax=unclassified Azospirillum TaxID=2630922 RepID=UPI003F49DA5F
MRSLLPGLTNALAAALMIMALAQGTQAASPERIEVTHAQGTTAVPRNPERVVVFDPASLDTLDALGVTVDGVPGGLLPPYLSRYASDDIPKVGTLFEPDYEAVNALAPDLIIIGGRSAAKYKELSRIAPTIDLTVDVKDFKGSVAKNVALLGRLFGKEREAADRLAALDRSIADLRTATAGIGDGLLVLTTGTKMSAYGPGSRFGILHSLFGVKPAVADLQASTHGQSISSEFVLDSDPDWLFVIDRDAAIGRGSAAQAVLDNELVTQTKAWKQGHVVYLDPVSWYLVGGGLVSLETMVDQLAQAFRKG